MADLRPLASFRRPKIWFEDVNVGDEVPPLVKKPTTRHLVMYAGASGDYVPIHYDKDVAAEAGHSNVIVHGALKSAYLAQLVTDWMGYTGQMLALSVSYRGIDYPGDHLTCRGRVIGKRVEEDVGLIDLEIWLENGEGEVTTPGQASVALPVKAHVAG